MFVSLKAVRLYGSVLSIITLLTACGASDLKSTGAGGASQIETLNAANVGGMAASGGSEFRIQSSPYVTWAIPACYHPATGEHFATTNARECLDNGFVIEATRFHVLFFTNPGDVVLYRCYEGIKHFVSTDPNCEGYTQEGRLGAIYSYPAPGSKALYRMYNPNNGDHMMSTDPAEGRSCGYRNEGMVGYEPGYFEGLGGGGGN